MISVYTTCKNKNEAEKISKHLLKNKLAACINIFSINSFYLWKNKIEKSKEQSLLIKTNKPFNKIKKEIEKLSSYEIPCIEKFNVDFNKKYKEWIGRELK